MGEDGGKGVGEEGRGEERRGGRDKIDPPDDPNPAAGLSVHLSRS
jgi:hypothetical protein